jgi:hypothetical protein
MRFSLALLLLVSPVFCIGQAFTEIAAEQGIFHQYTGGHYGGGASFYDVNGDGWDDLTFCNSGTNIVLYINQQGQFTGPFNVANNTGLSKSVTWVDYDNDGDADLFVTRYNGPWTLLRNDGDLLNMTNVTQEAGLSFPNYLTFGATWGDYDRDGYLDLYIANYNADGITNFMFHNNGDGTFTNATVATGTGDGSWYSFLGLFMDYNHDLWPDIYVVNDRLTATNNMYRNDGGTFTSVTAELGLTDFFFAMNASLSDYDHDGDMDLYSTNNPFGNRLYRQEDDFTYTQVANQAGVQVLDHSWSAQWIDYNNDTWEDLHVCCSPFWNQPGQNRFFTNNTNGTFTLDIFNGGFATDQGWSHTSVAGDFNNDGFFDLVVVNDAPDVTKLWRCNPNDNHYIKVKLQGVASNRDGVGTWMHLWSEGVEQMRYTHIGEGYMTQNSQTEIFGMAQYDRADSLTLFWPSGQIDTYYNLDVNQSYTFIEGGSVIANLTASSTNICPGDSVLLTAVDVLFPVWSNGESGASEIWVYEPGLYSYSGSNQFGIPFSSNSVLITSGESPSANIAGFDPLCAGQSNGSILVVLDEGDYENYSLEVNGLPAGWELGGLQAGDYHLVITDYLGCFSEYDVTLAAPETLDFTTSFNPISCFDGVTEAQIEVVGGTPPYTIDWFSVNPQALAAGMYSVVVSDFNGCNLEQFISIDEPDLLEVSSTVSHVNLENDGTITLEIMGGTAPYTASWTGPNGFTSQDIQLTGLTSGVYTALVTDSNGCLAITSVFILPVGIENLTKADLRIYPNPASNEIMISQLNGSPVHIALYNSIGQAVMNETRQPNGDVIVLHVSEFTRGQYFLLIDQSGDFSSHKIVLAE